MVNLKYIENPFTRNYLDSFECFREEKLFYDCIKRKIVVSDDVFENLETSFYTYLLIGDSEDWIGYVLFYNYDLVNGYLKTVSIELEKLLLTLKQKINNNDILIQINTLLLKLYNYEFSDTISLNTLYENISNLKNICIKNNQETSLFFENYNNNISSYLDNYKIYYNLDIHIALPLNINKKTIESTYYGFIKDVYQKVEELIINNFSSIPIVLKSTNETLITINNKQETKTKKILKK